MRHLQIFLAAWWRFETLSAVDLFSSIADSVEDTTQYGHSATPINFLGSVDFSEEQTIVAGDTVSGITNAIEGQTNFNDLIGGTYDHGGMCVIHDNQNEIRVEDGVENLVTCASNKWGRFGGHKCITRHFKYIFMGLLLIQLILIQPVKVLFIL